MYYSPPTVSFPPPEPRLQKNLCIHVSVSDVRYSQMLKLFQNLTIIKRFDLSKVGFMFLKNIVIVFSSTSLLNFTW